MSQREFAWDSTGMKHLVIVSGDTKMMNISVTWVWSSGDLHSVSSPVRATWRTKEWHASSPCCQAAINTMLAKAEISQHKLHKDYMYTHCICGTIQDTHWNQTCSIVFSLLSLPVLHFTNRGYQHCWKLWGHKWRREKLPLYSVKIYRLHNRTKRVHPLSI